MVNHTRCFLGAHDRLVQRLQRQGFGAHRIRQRPSDDPPGVHISDKSCVHEPVPGAHVGNVHHRQPMRAKSPWRYLVLSWMVDNTRVRTDPARNIKPDKQKSTEKIDGVVATIMALDRAIRCGQGKIELQRLRRTRITCILVAEKRRFSSEGLYNDISIWKATQVETLA